MLDSNFSFMRQDNFSYEDVASAKVGRSYMSIGVLYTEPDDLLKGKFSATYSVGAALVDSQIDINTFTEEKIADSKVQETMSKVSIRIRSQWEPGTPDAGLGPSVRNTLKDRRVFEHTTPQHQMLGSQRNP